MSIFDGVDLTDEQKTAIRAKVDDEIKGLQNKNSDLIGINKELKKVTISGLDESVIQSLKDSMKKLTDDKEADMVKNGQISELIQMKIDQATQEANARLTKAETEKEEAESKYKDASSVNRKMQIENVIRNAAGSIEDIMPTAVTDIVSRAMNIWKVTDNILTAFDGEKQIFDKESKPVTPSAWVESLRKESPHYFSKASGTGAGGSGDGGGESDWEKHFKPETRNLTKQSELYKTDIELYNSLNAKYNG